ncbi:hypothetical protein R1flu_005476 [Riccia fluitans]|uniref:Uncharacterized protein n=1 Tax=Riccia fluitans TaxID=41844 RepID=A0ABD1YXA0_9MARC
MEVSEEETPHLVSAQLIGYQCREAFLMSITEAADKYHKDIQSILESEYAQYRNLQDDLNAAEQNLASCTTRNSNTISGADPEPADQQLELERAKCMSLEREWKLATKLLKQERAKSSKVEEDW